MQGIQEQEYASKINLSLWRRLLKYARPQWKNLALTLTFMALCAVADVFFPRMTGYAIDEIIGTGQMEKLPGFIAVYLALTLGQTVCVYMFLIKSGAVEVGVCYEIRRLGFKKLQELPFSYYDKMPVGFLMTRLTSDTQRLGDTIGWSLLDLVWGGVFLVACTIQMLLLNWKLALAVLATMPVLAFLSFKFQRAILASHRAARKVNSQITGSFNEGIMGARTTKTLVREDANFEEFQQLTHEMKRASVRAATLSALFLPLVVSLGSIATAFVLWQGGSDVFAGVISLGTLQVFVSYSLQFFEPIQQIAGIFAEIQSAQAAAERVLDLLETEPDIQDTPEVIEKFGDAFHPKKENWPEIKGDVELKDVSFQYKDGEKVLDHFNLSVKAGQTIALVGETGSGKSTIVNLICRFYEPTSGNVLIDGVDYRERSQFWLQSHLGYVLQSPQLFSGTIRDNIRYGRKDATDEEVENAAKMVNADTFILHLPKGYDTQVGEGGNRLSTGEKQLISFARAILANPAIFVLDEATSSVDTQTEQVLYQATEKVLSGRTGFVVAHRLSTIRSADRILVIDKGHIMEDGTHHELMHKKGRYYELYTTQFMEEKNKAVLEA